MTQIQQTKEYAKFSYFDVNREIKESHVKALVKAIIKDNKLHQYPIVVDSRYRVINGQHRLEAAKQLQTPIFYIVDEDATIDDIVTGNTTVRQWHAQEYLDYYIKKGNKNYILLNEFADEYRLSIAISRKVLVGTFSGNDQEIKEFNEGKFEPGSLDQAEKLASLISRVREQSPDKAWTDRQCIKALAIVQASGNAKLFGEQLGKYQTVVTRRNSVKDYIDEFEDILSRDGKSIKLA